jgi:hypothetical protein
MKDTQELIQLWEEAKKAWNFNADEFEQWDNLSMTEKLELMLETKEHSELIYTDLL